MILNNGQEECVSLLVDWWKSETSKQVFEISGPAGSGKTTIIREMINRLKDIKFEEVLFVAFVGKAAMQMQLNGLNAATIHSTIYEMYEVNKLDKNKNVIMIEGRPAKTKKFVKKLKLDGNIKLIVVDEASMVSKKLAKDLLSFNIPVIALGDLNQLPPVGGDSYFLKKPDYILTEVMRQAKDSPILSFAQDIITFDKVPLPPFGTQINEQFTAMRKEVFFRNHAKELLEADVVICWKNSTREMLNKLIRPKYLYNLNGGNPDEYKDIEVGDKIICRKNNWDILADDYQLSLINGLIGTVASINMEAYSREVIYIDLVPEIDPTIMFQKVDLNLTYFTGDAETRAKFKGSLSSDYNIPYDGNLFEYGYAITCHLAQGSQYDYVIVLVEEGLYRTRDFRNWLYTAVTRAKEKLLLIF